MKPKTDIERTALNWWRSLRPYAYSQRQHLANPLVNTMSAAEKRLANAVAAMVRKPE
jgi:hypothetical protein